MTADTLAGLLLDGAESHGADDALVFPDSRLSYDGLLDAALGWAAGLRALGVERGDHVGLLLTTCPAFVEAMFGAALLGAVVVPINARYQPGELAYLIENADLKAIITTDAVADSVDFIARLNAALPGLAEADDPRTLELETAPILRAIVLIGGKAPPGFLAADVALDVTPDRDALIAAGRAVTGEEMGLILYTSGTTANPKGCLIKQKAICGNSANLARRYRLTAQDRFWSPLPIFHIAGILPLVAIMGVGGAYLTIPHFEAGMALDMLAAERATATFPCFVTIMQDLISHPKFATTDLSRVTLMNANFAVQPPAIREAMLKAMPHAIYVGTYGLTEGSGTICTSRLDDPLEARLYKLGVPLDDWEVRIVDAETGTDCPPGVQGEICARGPHMLSGYYKDAEKTAETIDADGWLHTGDVGSLDAGGNIMFHGRLKDMLKVGGENVAAAEIEAVLQSHPAVKLAQVVGVPHPRYVEVAAAFIELAPGASVSEEALIAHCKGKIAGFKIPRHIRFVTEWPMSTSKIQKFKLRATFLREAEEAA